MLLFKPWHVPMIVEGKPRWKTQTRRFGKRRWRVRAIHQCATRLFDRNAVFARVEILRVWSERLGAISLEDANAEGYDTVQDFLVAFHQVNRTRRTAAARREVANREVWVVEFTPVDSDGTLCPEVVQYLRELYGGGHCFT